ncbi:MAG: NfeD family protein [Sphingomonadaceae bacterium]
MQWYDHIDPHWFWLALGLFLAAAEIALPGMFLLWLAGAAIVTGLLSFLFPMNMAIEIVIFATISIALVFIGKRYIRAHPVSEADPAMNRRGMRLAGQVATVTEAIVDGEGRVRLGDSEWIARGPDCAAGSRVRISGADGAILLVEPVSVTPPGGADIQDANSV